MINTVQGLSRRVLRLPPFLVYAFAAAGALYAAYILGAVATGRALFADGSYFFVATINDGRFWPHHEDDLYRLNRLFVCLLNEFPLSLALRLGVSDLGVLRVLFGAGWFLTPAFLMGWTMTLAFRAREGRVFCLAALCYVTCFMPSEIFIVNPAFSAAGVAWVLACYALLPLRLFWWDWAIAALAGVVAMRAHEGMIFFAPTIAAMAMAAIFRERGSGESVARGQRIMRLWTASVGVASATFMAVWMYLYPLPKEAKSYEFSAVLRMLDPQLLMTGNMRVVLCVAAGVVAALFLALLERKKRRPLAAKALTFVAASAALMAIISGLRLSFDTQTASPFLEYMYRFFAVFGVAGFLGLLLIVYVADVRLLRRSYAMLLYLAAAGLAGHSFWQMGNNALWAQFVGLSRDALTHAERPVVQMREVVALTQPDNPALRYKWTWTWPSFGIAIGDSPYVATIFEPEDWQERMKIPARDENRLGVPFSVIEGRSVNFTPFNHLCGVADCRIGKALTVDPKASVAPLALEQLRTNFRFVANENAHVPVVVVNSGDARWPQAGDDQALGFTVGYSLMTADGRLILAAAYPGGLRPMNAHALQYISMPVPALGPGIYRIELVFLHASGAHYERAGESASTMLVEVR